jgi:hypothetical protein
MNSPEIQENRIPARVKKKSFLCRIILSMALTYFLILALLFLAGSMFSGNIIHAISSYYSPEDPSPDRFRWFVMVGTALFSLAVAGIILIMLNHKAGFYISIFALLVIFVLDLNFLNFDWLRYLVHTGFIFILGIAHFSKRCYYKPDKS